MLSGQLIATSSFGIIGEGRCSTTFRLFFVLSLLMLSVPLGAQNVAAGNNQAGSTVPPPTAGTPLSGQEQSAELRRRAEELERRNAILEARAQLSAQMDSQLAQNITIFSVLIAFVAIVFGLSTREAAVAQAKEGVTGLQKEFEAYVNRAKAEIQALEITGAKLRKALEAAPAGQAPERPEDRETVESAAEIAIEKPAMGRSADDLKALIVSSLMAKNWDEMVGHARALLYLHEGEPGAFIYGQYFLGYALDEIDHQQEAIDAYDKLIARHGESTDPETRSLVARAICNKGVALAKLQKHRQAIECYDDLVDRFKNSDDADLQGVVATAHYNSACRYASLEDMPNMIEKLKLWKTKVGSVDCDKIRSEDCFDPVRQEPLFVEFMQENGCVGGPTAAQGTDA